MGKHNRTWTEGSIDQILEMEKYNRSWTEGSIDQVPEMEITWNWQSPKFFGQMSFHRPMLRLQVYWLKLCKTRRKFLNECAREQQSYLLKAMT